MLLHSFRISKSDKTSKSNKQKIPHKTGIPPPKKKIENVSPVHVNIDPRSRPTFPLNYVITKAGKKRRKCSHQIIIVTLRCYY